MKNKTDTRQYVCIMHLFFTAFRYLQSNYITALPSFAFNNMSLTYDLHLESNQILTIDEQAFDNIAVEDLYVRDVI